jgi:hypothetical protein
MLVDRLPAEMPHRGGAIVRNPIRLRFFCAGPSAGHSYFARLWTFLPARRDARLDVFRPGRRFPGDTKFPLDKVDKRRGFD